MRKLLGAFAAAVMAMCANSTSAQQATVYSGCGLQSWATGFSRGLGMTTGGDLCVSGGTIATITTITNPVGIKGADGSTISSATNPVPTTAYDSNGTQANYLTPSLVVQSQQQPNGATIITGNAAGTTGAVVGTLAAAVGKTTYICGFNVAAIGGTAAVGPITIAGLITSSMVYQLTSSATGVMVPTQPFFPCIPASSTNTAITVTTTADGTASAVNVNSWGYQQ